MSLLNDCKYGHDIQGDCMRLTLLRGPIRPDPDSDQGEHRFTYSLFPHAGTWQDAGTVHAAFDLNSPLLPVPAGRHGGALPGACELLSTQGEGVLLGALKPAEEGRGCVLRLAEVHGGRTQVTVRSRRALKGVQECDRLERAQGRTSGGAGRGGGHQFTTSLAPFEIRTFRLSL